jgi:predicted secreted protein
VATIAIAILLLTLPAEAHVGSPNVFYEGDAGPYHLFVTVNVPAVIPGVADVQIRADSDDVRQVSTAVTRLAGAGSQYTPVPDAAQRSPIDPHLFTSSLWLMEYGSMRVVINVAGTHGPAQMSVPVPSAARKMLPMPRALGGLLLTLAIVLAIGAISIVGAAARESRLAPGDPITPQLKRRGLRATAIATGIVATLFYLAFAWWNSDAQNYAAITALFKPPKLELTIVDGNRLAIRPSPTDQAWLKYKVMDGIVPDHGHLMHLFLVHAPALDRIWHLHPTRQPDGSFVAALPSIEPGNYSVFADIVDQSGFPWTLVGSIDLPQITGTPLTGDDSGGNAPALTSSSDSAVDVLDDGTRVVWHRDSAALRANVPTILRFEVQDQNGNPATGMEPYMGMAAHAEIMSADLQVFAHIHPSGSVPMAALMMASASSAAPDSMAGMNMSDANLAISPELSMPYGFPKSGHYRIFLQFKRSDKIETAHFDTVVN